MYTFDLSIKEDPLEDQVDFFSAFCINSINIRLFIQMTTFHKVQVNRFMALYTNKHVSHLQ